jgi:hypothetical protein
MLGALIGPNSATRHWITQFALFMAKIESCVNRTLLYNVVDDSFGNKNPVVP